MNKRKILTMALAVAMVAILAVGGSLAYLTDTDAKINTFTTGNVDITLKENFDKNNAKVLPGVNNAVQKEVWIDLATGSEDAYVWYTYAIPAALDSTDGSTGTNNIIHVNAYGRTWDKYFETSNGAMPSDKVLPKDINMTWDHDPNVELPELVGPEGYIGSYVDEQTKIEYNVYLVLYHGVLSNTANKEGTVGTKTTIAMSQVYMDAGVDTKQVNGKTVYIDKNDKEIAYDLTEGFDIVVNAYAIQSAGIKDVYEAYSLYPVEGLTVKAE